MATLSDSARARYARNLLIPGIGEEGQARLAKARVLIVGLGGLGSPAAFYLAAAGVGAIGLADADVVEDSNLQRQIVHAEARVGQTKVASASAALAALNAAVETVAHNVRVTDRNAGQLVAQYDAVIEATDSFASKFVVNDACLRNRIPFATAGVLGMSGQALFVVPGQTACLRCAVPEPPEGVPTTSEQGVLGAAAGILGCIEAQEVLRWIVGVWKPAGDGAGLLHRLDGDAMRFTTMRLERRPDCRCARNADDPSRSSE